MAGVLAGVVGFFFFLMTRLTAPDMALLYNDLSTSDSGRIVTKLESMNVPYELKGNGNTIMVPADQALRLRVSMAQEGLPAGGNIGYEIFDKSETLGTSNFVLNINHLRALEGELARTIGSINYVKSARVHLALPQRELFTRDQQEPTASVVLQMNGGRRLSKSEVQAIQNLVAASVPRLKANRISIIDGQGTLLARGQDGDPADANAGSQNGDEAKTTYETRTVRMVEDMLERVLGPGHARVEVTADLDFDRISTTSEKYDPDGQVVRSTQTVAENSSSRDAAAQTVSVANNIPAPPQQNGDAPNAATNASNRNEETVNYEISRTTQTHVRESGSIKRLSVAVVVDGNYADGKTYQPRSAEELEQLGRLVKSAVGFDEKRGDTVEVVNMRFAGGPDTADDGPRPLFGLDKNDYIRIAEMVTLGIVAILVILLVVRPLVRRFLEALPEAIANSKQMIAETTAAASKPALPGASPLGMIPAMAGIDGGALADATIDMQQVEGRVRESSVKKIGEIVDKHPEEAVNIIRNWMYRES
ncbi:MAG TPA: flagellar basal-body MS-ring/collar protein FliF [Alphaproteobacteria bacterium]